MKTKLFLAFVLIFSPVLISGQQAKDQDPSTIRTITDTVYVEVERELPENYKMLLEDINDYSELKGIDEPEKFEFEVKKVDLNRGKDQGIMVIIPEAELERVSKLWEKELENIFSIFKSKVINEGNLYYIENEKIDGFGDNELSLYAKIDQVDSGVKIETYVADSLKVLNSDADARAFDRLKAYVGSFAQEAYQDYVDTEIDREKDILKDKEKELNNLNKDLEKFRKNVKKNEVDIEHSKQDIETNKRTIELNGEKIAKLKNDQYDAKVADNDDLEKNIKKEIKKLERDKDRLQDDNKDLHSDIVEYEQEIMELEHEIKENLNKSFLKKAEIRRQQTIVELYEKKKSNISNPNR
ncbi:coiled-coil domain-containing protein [Marinigracilibium pacificum]|uniref:Uncharacterized protein n=1 Tax=Marinigracilibium pacificum TaxID=2729599 RepID=A0A848J1F9_9BACT|nr:hypothetical protein [Marinigracilibium pacificum]NMM48380.1 hypothetical protein [Marinigracilibium pacificum]